MILELTQIECRRCGGSMPKLRLDIYGYDFCIECSDVQPKVGRIRVVGEGDHTATELDIVDQVTAKKLQEMENTSRGVRNVPLEILNFEQEELSDDVKAITEATKKALKGETIVEDEDDDEELDEDDVELLDEEDE